MASRGPGLREGTSSVGLGMVSEDTRSCFSPMDRALQLHGASEIPTNPKQLPCKCIMSSLLILSCHSQLLSTCYFSGTLLWIGNFKRTNNSAAEKRVLFCFVLFGFVLGGAGNGSLQEWEKYLEIWNVHSINKMLLHLLFHLILTKKKKNNKTSLLCIFATFL